MTKTILITGASTGIGSACVEQAAIHNLNIVATARNSKLLESHLQYKNVQIIIADISKESGRSKIIKSINQPIDYLLHNASNLDQPQKFADIALSDFQKSIATNVEPLIFLTQGLLNKLILKDKNSRVLCMTSRAAINAYSGISNYCISKAAALMACQMLKVECEKFGILVNSYSPGVVDTAMQKTLRSSTPEIFSHSEDFVNLKKNQLLAQPNEVAKHIINTFCKTSDSKFSTSNWEFPKPN